MNATSETRNCPFCLHPVKPEEERVRCPKCGVVHHSDCWRANGRCSVYGCDGWATWSESIADSIAPSVEDAVLVDKSAEAKQPQPNRCIKCGAEVGIKQVLCLDCKRNDSRYWFENCSGPALLMITIAVLVVRAILT